MTSDDKRFGVFVIPTSALERLGELRARWGQGLRDKRIDRALDSNAVFEYAESVAPHHAIVPWDKYPWVGNPLFEFIRYKKPEAARRIPFMGLITPEDGRVIVDALGALEREVGGEDELVRLAWRREREHSIERVHALYRGLVEVLREATRLGEVCLFWDHDPGAEARIEEQREKQRRSAERARIVRERESRMSADERKAAQAEMERRLWEYNREMRALAEVFDPDGIPEHYTYWYVVPEPAIERMRALLVERTALFDARKAEEALELVSKARSIAFNEALDDGVFRSCGERAAGDALIDWLANAGAEDLSDMEHVYDAAQTRMLLASFERLERERGIDGVIDGVLVRLDNDARPVMSSHPGHRRHVRSACDIARATLASAVERGCGLAIRTRMA